MKKLMFALLAVLPMAVFAQITPEEIIKMRPALPDNRSIAEYIVKGENATVDAYLENIDAVVASVYPQLQAPRTSEAAVQKKQQQMQSTAAKRQDAGQRMMKFMASLTEEQQKKMMSFRKEEDSFNYLKSIGKWDEFMQIMEGVDPNVGNEEVVSADEMAWLQKDFTAEQMAADRAVSDAYSKLQAYAAEMQEQASKVEATATEQNSTKQELFGGKETLTTVDTEKVDAAMIDFYATALPKWKSLYLGYLKALEGKLVVAKKEDKKRDIMNKVGGAVDHTPLAGNASYTVAFQYLDEAKKLVSVKL